MGPAIEAADILMGLWQVQPPPPQPVASRASSGTGRKAARAPSVQQAESSDEEASDGEFAGEWEPQAAGMRGCGAGWVEMT